MCCSPWASASTRRRAACVLRPAIPRRTAKSRAPRRFSAPRCHAHLPVPSLEEDLAGRLARGEEVVLATAVKVDGQPPSRAGAKILLSRTATLAGTLGCSEFDSAALADAARIADAGAPVLRTYRHDLGSIEVYLEPYLASPTLVVFGATPVAAALLRWAPEVGFRTVLVDTRPDRLKGGTRPPAGTSLRELRPGHGSERY